MSECFEPLKDPVEIHDVRKLDLRIGTIKRARPLPKSEKLLALEIDLGFETRTIVSGISHHYHPEEILGKKVIVVVNLKSTHFMGVESQGMILTGSSKELLELVTVHHLPGGSIVT